MRKIYKKSFDFGKVDAEGKGKRNLVRLDVELKLEDKGPVFSASGEVWDTRHYDIIMGGQCLGDIWREYKHELENGKQYAQILRLWDLYHLNDMNPGCKHQRAWHWGDKPLDIVKLKLSWTKAGERVHDIERRAQEQLKAEGHAEYTPAELELVRLPYWVTVPAERVPDYPLYEVESRETKTAGWVRPEEHPEGVLGKPCPVCSYAYGTAWVYEPIPAEDLREILQLLEVDYQERARIMQAVRGANE